MGAEPLLSLPGYNKDRHPVKTDARPEILNVIISMSSKKMSNVTRKALSRTCSKLAIT